MPAIGERDRDHFGRPSRQKRAYLPRIRARTGTGSLTVAVIAAMVECLSFVAFPDEVRGRGGQGTLGRYSSFRFRGPYAKFRPCSSAPATWSDQCDEPRLRQQRGGPANRAATRLATAALAQPRRSHRLKMRTAEGSFRKGRSKPPGRDREPRSGYDLRGTWKRRQGTDRSCRRSSRFTTI